MSKLRIVMAQMNSFVGDIEGNAKKIIDFAQKARQELKADLIVFPELALTGYPPEDLVLRDDFYKRTSEALNHIRKTVTDIAVILGYTEKTSEGRFNSACFISNDQLLVYHKRCLPNYSVFDEIRYFTPGNTSFVVTVNNIPVGLTICEDLWHPDPIRETIYEGAKLLISINASPFDKYKHLAREKLLLKHITDYKVPIIYVNCVGGQDELIFDGGSLAMNSFGEIPVSAAYFEETLIPVDIEYDEKSGVKIINSTPSPNLSYEQRIYSALTLGIKDYIEKHHFPGVIIGLSGGIDSALTLAIAVDALGSERVHAVLMPSRFTASISNEDAIKQATDMNVKYSIISIEPIFRAFLESLSEEFKGLKPDVTEENLQARCRGTILMAISNKTGFIVLSTGNKSEMSVGYSTLYGDLAGGFCLLKDVPKTWVYQLADYRNAISPVIPQRVITRPPSAELAPDQKDEDLLPPYPILDVILERYIEKDQSLNEIVNAGFDKAMVKKIIRMVDRSEYKRRQAPIGVRITERAFGRDRRYPITSGYHRYLLD